MAVGLQVYPGKNTDSSPRSPTYPQNYPSCMDGYDKACVLPNALAPSLSQLVPGERTMNTHGIENRHDKS